MTWLNCTFVYTSIHDGRINMESVWGGGAIERNLYASRTSLCILNNTIGAEDED